MTGMRGPLRRFALIAALAGALGGCSSGEPGATPSSTASSSAASSATGSPSHTPTAPPLRTGPPKLAQVGTFTQPIYVTTPAGDPRLFVVEQGGRIRVVKNGTAVRTPFLDISGMVRNSGEQG